MGFPLTNRNEMFFHNITGITFLKYVYENLIDMNNLTLIKELNDNIPEISVDFSKNNNGKLNINLHFNKSLSQERKGLENLTKPFSKNIILSTFILFFMSATLFIEHFELHFFE